MTPTEAAAQLSVDPKRVRAWLRAHRGAPTGARWEIDGPTFQQLKTDLAQPSPRSAERQERLPGSRPRDEIYVIDLCDEMFGVSASRQHRFDWLVGDPGADGRPRALPVDAYYEELGLVVEYRELQHDRGVAFFDKPDRLTVSGVHRGAQRRIYDQRRDDLIPQHSLRLWVIAPSEVGGDRRGRLSSRDHDRDLAHLRTAWQRAAD